jgi:DNA-binding GntR family transcriptional regulator
MESTTTHIVESLYRAIVEHRLQPGAKLVEQKLADHFGVSRTLVRQALYQLEQQRLVVIEPARGAFVASPSLQEAQEVFEVRRMLEAEMTRMFVRQINPPQIRELREHLLAEKAALAKNNVSSRSEMLGEFHILIAKLIGNDVLKQMLRDLIARCALITLMYQSVQGAHDSNQEHIRIVGAMVAKDENLAVRLMEEHLLNVVSNLTFDRKPPASDIATVFDSMYASTMQVDLATAQSPLTHRA